jgi:hypothetical protein
MNILAEAFERTIGNNKCHGCTKSRNGVCLFVLGDERIDWFL